MVNRRSVGSEDDRDVGAACGPVFESATSIWRLFGRVRAAHSSPARVPPARPGCPLPRTSVAASHRPGTVPSGLRHLAAARGFRDRLRPRPPLPRVLDALPRRQGDARRRCRSAAGSPPRSRADVLASARPPRAGRRARHQGRRPRDARHPRRLQHRVPTRCAGGAGTTRSVGARTSTRCRTRRSSRHARNWDALCLYGWHPYMYNPQLKRWLGRIARADPGAVGRQRRRRDAGLRPRATPPSFPARASS